MDRNVATDPAARVRFRMVEVARKEGVTAAARQFEVSRPTVYKALHRFETEGAQGLLDRPRGGQGSIRRRFSWPAGIDIDPYGNVYVADTENNRVQVFDSDGGFRMLISGSAAGALKGPEGIALGPEGRIFVADTDNHQIQVFDASGAFIALWGQQGSANGRFGLPRGVAVGGDGQVYVADSENHRIQVFDRITLDHALYLPVMARNAQTTRQ